MVQSVITTNQAAISALFRRMNRYVGNLPPMSGVFPDYPAPVVRNAGPERELIMMRWDMPPRASGSDRRRSRPRSSAMFTTKSTGWSSLIPTPIRCSFTRETVSRFGCLAATA
jgi:putative SOS response-associated peptidase YedK